MSADTSARRRYATRYDDFRAAALAAPGQWIALPGLTRRLAERRAAHVRNGAGRWGPAGTWDARVVSGGSGRGFTVEARLVVETVELAADGPL